MADKNDTSWFEEAPKAGQDDGDEGQPLLVEEEQGEELQEVDPKELEPKGELKTKEEKVPRVALRIPSAGESKRRAPKGFKIPKDMVFPRGIDVLFITLPASITAYSGKGDRQVVLWPLTDADEKLAISRSMANAARAGTELAKQMIRAIDGERINWTGDPSQPGADIDRAWHEFGPKGRNLLQRLFNQMHAMTEDELVHFFEHCIAVVNMG